jgi:hypothetical protein
MAGHEHLHELFGFLVAFLALDDDLVDVLRVQVTDRALDQAAFLVDEGRGGGLEREFAYRFPHADR